MNCPCGKPACWRIWEARLAFCQKHGRAWLASEEKQIVGAAFAEYYAECGDAAPLVNAPDLLGARNAFLRFVARVERDASLWTKIKRWFNRWFGGGR